MIEPDWNHIRAFLKTAETGSLSAAARKLGLTQPTLSRQVAALEADLGLLLFERLGKSLSLTDAGRELLAHSQKVGKAVDGLQLAASGQTQSIEGTIRITASDVTTAFVLPPVLHELRLRAPRLTIDLVAANDIRDLMRREADIAIRHVRPEQPELITRLVQEPTARFYAATSYLERRGRPRSLADFSNHDFVSFSTAERSIEFFTPLGIHLTAENFKIGSNSGLAAWELVKQGFGICPMADDVAAAATGIEPLLPEMDPIVFPVWLTTHRELHTSRRIRLVFDLLAEFFTEKQKRAP
ncbi:transcriptional regulator, LysR family protein [Roseobacter sp. SK209-2-6]|uniref:LysR family transcriptional regulator n=1 Tax=Roseobacter sp. SK209-2-6 TaxID=388739 RepID=UPI0000F3EF4B|nr:LysR family transcriptional regulator [Roseobacter sp. SK209-2-6]EBA16750.1 transcriptional regulator, LysR family protein [Roseobacter sp. SK209-2-6]